MLHFIQEIPISHKPPCQPPFAFILSFASRSRRALSRCLTSDTDGRDSRSGSGFTGEDESIRIGSCEGFENEGVEAMVVGGTLLMEGFGMTFVGGGV